MIKVISDSIYTYTRSRTNSTFNIHFYEIENDSIFTKDYIKQFFYTDVRLYDFAILSNKIKKTIFLLQNQDIKTAQEILHNIIS